LAAEVSDSEEVPESHHHDKDGLYEGVGDLGYGRSVHAWQPSFLMLFIRTFVYPGKRRGNLRYEDGARLAVGRSLEEGNSVLFDTNPKQRCETSRNTESSNPACLGGFCNSQK
jgi:hypothetical protein